MNQDVVQKIAELTHRGKIAWEETVYPKTFQVSFSECSVQVSECDYGGYALRVYDINANLVREIEGECSLWAELYKNARGIAHDAGKVIERLLSELAAIQ